jgi:hypothetical protein
LRTRAKGSDAFGNPPREHDRGWPDATRRCAAHHIVSWQHPPAYDSQQLLFGWCIGINDVDNGVYLPRFKKTVVDSLPDARKHSPLHTYVYHSQVFIRLVVVEPARKNSEAGRIVLRRIKSELVAGTFPYREEHLA